MVQKKQQIKDFQDGRHIKIPIRTIRAILIYKSSRCFLSSFKSIGLLVQEKKLKKYFQTRGHGGRYGFLIGIILHFFGVKVTPNTFYYIKVDWHFVSGQDAKNRFSRWPPRRLSWNLDRNNFSYFKLKVTLMLPAKFQVNWTFDSGNKGEKNIFSRWSPHGGHHGFLIGTILGSFDLQVIPMLPTKFRVSWPFMSGEEAKKYIFMMAAKAAIL